MKIFIWISVLVLSPVWLHQFYKVFIAIMLARNPDSKFSKAIIKFEEVSNSSFLPFVKILPKYLGKKKVNINDSS